MAPGAQVVVARPTREAAVTDSDRATAPAIARVAVTPTKVPREVVALWTLYLKQHSAMVVELYKIEEHTQMLFKQLGSGG